MRKRSTLTNLLEYLEVLTKIMDEKDAQDIIYLDFSKAFDKVPVRRLLSKCEGLGIQGDVLVWITEWITGRQQRVVINGQASGWADITSGVVQGAVLGPCLFLIYLNDIDGAVAHLSGILSKFADDSKWARKVLNEEDRKEFQEGLDRLMEWAEDWQMEFIKKKCHIIHLGKNNRGYEYNLGGTKLESSECEKDLGVMVHQTLKPSKQCAKTANMVLGQLTRGVGYRDKKVFIDLYKTYVRPHLEYCVPAWCPWLIGDKELLEAVQRRAVKAVTNLRSQTYEGRLQELGLDSLEERRKRGDLITAYKVLTGKDNVDPTTWFTNFDHGVGAVTRRQAGHLNVEIPVWDGEVRRNFWSVRVCNPWNNLPDEVKEVETLNGFKNAVDKHMGWGRQLERNREA